MKTLIIFIFVLIIAATAFIVFSYMEEASLGIILAAIIISWPLVFLLITKIMKKKEKRKEEEKRIKQDIVDDREVSSKPTKEHEKKEETIEETKEEEFVVAPKKDVNLNKTREELKKLKRTAEVLDEEKKEGILSEETYNELKKQNDEAIEKLEEEIAKASGEIRERKAYCKKGDHYVNLNICLPSKVKGYVICPEHNEEIRVE